MTDQLTPEERELLATKVMGWEIKYGQYWCGKYGFRFHAWQWAPDKNIMQAMMLVDECDTWKIDKGMNGYFITVCLDNEIDHSVLSQEKCGLPLAICRAILEAIK